LENIRFSAKLQLHLKTLKLHSYYLLLASLSAVLLTMAWQPIGWWFLSFIGFLPLLYLYERAKQKSHNGWFLFYTFLSLMLWNMGSTYWVANASLEGAIAAFVINSLLMSLPWVLMQRYQERVGEHRAQWILITGWIAMELLHLNWEISWPWLVLGNVFSTQPHAVQWYEYTGHMGGSLWIWWVNIHVFRYLRTIPSRSRVMNYSKALNLIFFQLFAPFLLSWYVMENYQPSERPMKVLVVQPNIDPYRDKFGGLSPVDQTKKMLDIATEKMDSNVRLVCFPETALVGGINEDQFGYEATTNLILSWMNQWPNTAVLTGADTYRFYEPGKKSPTARLAEDNLYYDSYNTAMFWSGLQQVDFYHKSKLVPGVEKMPYPKLFGFLEKLAVNLGGTSGSLGSDPEAKVFSLDKFVSVAPVICYESVYGEFVSTYVAKGAQLICIITNDGWWGNTPGYRQHFDYARLRAIETRRYVARSANTGISGFIDDKGNIMSQTHWWNPDAQVATIQLNQVETFYVKYGDWLAKICAAWWLFQLIKLLWKRNEME
jgi:apolipoprotein N-acyltransferase